jgi:hypothetical protein
MQTAAAGADAGGGGGDRTAATGEGGTATGFPDPGQKSGEASYVQLWLPALAPGRIISGRTFPTPSIDRPRCAVRFIPHRRTVTVCGCVCLDLDRWIADSGIGRELDRRRAR